METGSFQSKSLLKSAMWLMQGIAIVLFRAAKWAVSAANIGNNWLSGSDDGVHNTQGLFEPELVLFCQISSINR
jgi:hypothetical protein